MEKLCRRATPTKRLRGCAARFTKADRSVRAPVLAAMRDKTNEPATLPSDGLKFECEQLTLINYLGID